MNAITFLGTGNAMCTRCYNTCFYIRSNGGGMLVDAGGGNGIFRQLHKAHITYEEIRHIFVTHVHTDHILGVVWLIRKISPLIHKGKHPGKLFIYCNSEVKHALETICRLLIPRKINRAIGESIILQEVHDGEQLMVDDMNMTCFDLGTTKTMQYGFRLLMPDGQSVVCLGDEPFYQRNEPYVRGCDWLLCEAFCLYKDREQFRPYDKHHSTALDAGQQAEVLGAKNLVLYHTEDTNLATRKEAYTAEAKTHFSGQAYCPNELETITLTATADSRQA